MDADSAAQLDIRNAIIIFIGELNFAKISGNVAIIDMLNAKALVFL